MTRPDCIPVQEDLADLVAGDSAAIARHSEHLASCDDCRDARYEASRLADVLPHAGSDHVLPDDFVARLLAKVDSDHPNAGQTLPGIVVPTLAPSAKELPAAPIPVAAPAPAKHEAAIPITRAKKSRKKLIAFGAIAALAAGGVGLYQITRTSDTPTGSQALARGDIGTVKTIERASKDKTGGLEIRDGNGWRPLQQSDVLAAGAELRTDERTRAAVDFADGSRFVLDHKTTLSLGDWSASASPGSAGARSTPAGSAEAINARSAKLTAGRVVAEVMPAGNRTAVVETPSGRIDVLGTRFAATATDQLTVVQVVRGNVTLTTAGDNRRDEVRAGEEGVIDHGNLAVNAAPGLAREVEWSELGPKTRDTQTGSGLGALRAYKPGETRDRDWNLALASHDVKVRIVGPVARTEITETFRNDTGEQLEGVYQFPLPPDAQIDALALDVKDAPGGFEQGAFLDKERANKIWKGVIEKAAPKKIEIARDEIIWVDGAWRDPALLDWKRGGRFELKIFPIPAKGARTIKIAYTQIVTPRGPWRQYVYPLPHSADGSTVADKLSIDVEVRGAQPGQVRAAGYDLVPDPARSNYDNVAALALTQTGFVPRGDLVVDYRAKDDGELRAWTFAGGFAVAPDDKLAEKKNVGIDPKVVAAQRDVAADARPTAVLALRPKLPRWREAKTHDYVIVVDSSQSMVGERYTRAGELATRLVEQMDRRDRFTVLACDSDCRKLGALKTPTVGAAGELAPWLSAQPAAGASDLVAAVRTATGELADADPSHERWVIFVGDGFSSTGFRKAGDVEKAIAATTKGVHVTTIGIGTDADAGVLAAAARGGGGSYLAWVPGQSVKSAAIAGLESTFGATLRDATITLPSGLADVAPTVLPTIRTGEEVLVAARLTGDVKGEVVLKGMVGGEPFEQRYPLSLAVSSAGGNGFVPRLWATLAIEQIEHAPKPDRTKIVALSQGYGVMSRETSLLVLESPAMFDAFGVDRSVPAAKWTGQESLDEVISNGTISTESQSIAGGKRGAGGAPSADLKKSKDDEAPRTVAPTATATATKPAPMRKAPKADKAGGAMDPFDEGRGFGRGGMRGPRGGMFAMRRSWVRVPSVALYEGVSPSITKAIGDAERALAKSPDSRERHRALVQALSYAGEISRANQLAAKWLERDRLDPQALGYQADLLGRDGQRELALRMLAGVVDLDADRPASHERMVQAYEHLGRLPQACSHRIALAAIAPKDGKAAAGAVRCLRSLAREPDADIVLAGLDDTTRDATTKALAAPAAPATGKGDVVIDARWDGGEDLDVSLVTPDGTRVSWMGGKSDVVVTDATSTSKEQLAIKSIKRGNYLIEIARSTPTTGKLVRGTLDVSVLGSKKSIPFDLTDARKTVARLSVNLEERLETLDESSVKLTFGNIPNPGARRVILARSPSLRGCFTPGTSGRMLLTVTVEPGGSTHTVAQAGGDLAAATGCIESNLANMHVEGTSAGTFRVPLAVTSN